MAKSAAVRSLVVFGEAVAIALGNLVDEALSAQEAESAGYLSGEDLLVMAISTARIKETSDIAVGESGGDELAARNSLEERQVGGIADAKGP